MSGPTCPNCGGPVNEDGIESVATVDDVLLAGAMRAFLAPKTHESQHGYVNLTHGLLTLDGNGDLTEDEAAAVQRILDSR